MPMALKSDDSTSTMCALPLTGKYAALAGMLRRSFSEREASAIARAMCAIDEGAGEVTVRDLLEKEGGFEEKKARVLARVLHLFHKGFQDDDGAKL